jgi:hypothetical protein
MAIAVQRYYVLSLHVAFLVVEVAVVAQLLTFTMTWALVAQGAASAQGPSPTGSAATTAIPAASTRPREDLTGQWKYNPDQSINAATGRLETARAANERRGAATAAAPRGGPGPGAIPGGGVAGGAVGGFPGAGLGDPGGGGGGGGGGFGSGMPPSAALNIYQQSRDTLRDLMEIAPGLSFDVTGTSVVLTDDLERTLTFPTDGRKQKYVLGAAMFDAKAYWEGSKLKVDIEGPNSLKMNQTLFLSEDGSRLFVIIRVGQPAKGERPTGVNRVYDRVR